LVIRKKIMSKAGKIWGTTELVEANGALEFHRIEMTEGGVCSKHLHEFKWNGFFCESGRMLVRVWQNDYDLVDETILEAGDYTKVKPGLYHQFECLEDGVAFELYWAEFNHNDIKRESVGYDRGTNVDTDMIINPLWDMSGDGVDPWRPYDVSDIITTGSATLTDSITTITISDVLTDDE
tara:strand:+ start:1751 stop:2290 length:540 start_codon:yes stop_codon:yes gene_type:complete